MKVQRYLALCDPHNSIIHEFGCDNSCTKVAGICIRGCNQHDHILKNSKHQFMDARQLYSIVQQLRERYKSFKINFRQVYLKNYLSMVYSSLDSFEDHINTQYLEKTPLIDIFCKYSNQKEIFQMFVQEKYSQMQFSQLKCKEICQIRNFQRILSKETKQQQEKRIIKLLSKVFEHYLVSNKILSQDKNVFKSTNEKIQQESLSKVYKELENKLRNYQLSKNQSRIANLIIKIKEQGEKIQQNFNNEEFCIRFSEKFKRYIQKTRTQNVQLSINISLVTNKFWKRLFLNLSSLTTLKNFTLKTPQSDIKLCMMFQQQLKQSINIPFHLEVKSNLQIQIQPGQQIPIQSTEK